MVNFVNNVPCMMTVVAASLFLIFAYLKLESSRIKSDARWSFGLADKASDPETKTAHEKRATVGIGIATGLDEAAFRIISLSITAAVVAALIAYFN